MTHHAPPLTDEERDLCRQGLRILERVAKRYWRRYRTAIELDELVSAGLPAVTRAVRRFEPSRGRFGPYLVQRLRWTLTAEVRKRLRRRLDPRRGRPLGVAPTMTDGRVYAPPNGTGPEHELAFGDVLAGTISVVGDLSEVAVARDRSPEESAVQRELSRALHDAIGQLSPRTRDVLLRHYFSGQRLADIARELDVSISTISRFHREALVSLADRLRRAAIS